MAVPQPNPEALIDRLERFRITFPASIAAFAPDDLKWKPDDESWSVHEIVCHMLDEEREDFRTRVLMTLKDPTQTWPSIDPGGWPISRNYDSLDLKKQLDEWTKERTKSVQLLRELKNPDWSSTHQHNHFGPMVAIDLLAAWSGHDALHLRQLSKRLHQLASRDAGPDSTTRYAGDW